MYIWICIYTKSKIKMIQTWKPKQIIGIAAKAWVQFQDSSILRNENRIVHLATIGKVHAKIVYIINPTVKIIRAIFKSTIENPKLTNHNKGLHYH